MERLFKLKKRLEFLGYNSIVFNNTDEAVDYLKDKLKNRTVGFGGSMSVYQMGLYEKLEGVCKEITWHWGKNATKELFLKAMTADVYITSANAISENGEIVNIDGNGNRVAASIYGPDEIIFLIGKNKICKDIDEAVYRARNIAAPLNARRLNKNTPCAKDLKCHNCERDDCFCNIFTVHRRKNSGIDAEVILINESLGF